MPFSGQRWTGLLLGITLPIKGPQPLLSKTECQSLSEDEMRDMVGTASETALGGGELKGVEGLHPIEEGRPCLSWGRERPDCREGWSPLYPWALTLCSRLFRVPSGVRSPQTWHSQAELRRRQPARRQKHGTFRAWSGSSPELGCRNMRSLCPVGPGEGAAQVQ